MTNANETMTAVEWNSTVPVARALRMLGYRAADLDTMTEAMALARCVGAWDANERERHVAWKSIAAHLAAK